MKLKSPMSIQSSSSGILRSYNHWTKLSLLSPVQGPYILTKVQDYADWVEVKWTERAKGSQCITMPEKIELFHMTIKPPEDPLDGT
jgi:hypothetical protein